MTTPLDPNTMAMMAQLLKQRPQADPFAANRQTAAAMATPQEVGSTGQGMANLGSAALGGISSMADKWTQNEMNKQYIDELTARLAAQQPTASFVTPGVVGPGGAAP